MDREQAGNFSVFFFSPCMLKTLIISSLMTSVQMYVTEFVTTASPIKHMVIACTIRMKLFKITTYCIIASFVCAFSLDSSIVPEHNRQAHIPTVT